MSISRVLTAAASALLLAVGLTATTPSNATAAGPSAGSTGAGDPYFPLQGNGGYDVASYDLAVGYTPATKQLTGTATIEATATQDLSRFDLDLRRNLVVSSVEVDGANASFAQPANLSQELVITPRKTLRDGKDFTVTVRYAGTAQQVIDPDGSEEGFIPTDDGAFVASQPQGSPSWFPVNDSPRDKATYKVAVTVPKGLTAVSNGKLLGSSTSNGLTTWSWRLDKPVSSYLVTATIGKFDVRTGTTPGGIPYYVAVDPSYGAAGKTFFKDLPAMFDYFTQVFGPYPFGEAGAVLDNAPDVGYTLETATRPVFSAITDQLTLAHEIAHQWYGDDVTLSRWRDIWVNEGFAEFASYLWDEHTGGETTDQHLADILARPASDDDTWAPPPGNPGGADQIFATSLYDRGGATLAALRKKVGDQKGLAILRGWLQQHAYGNATVDQFTAYAERVAGTDLTPFFQDWLYRAGKPTGTY